MEDNRRLTTKLSEHFGQNIKLSFVYEKGFDKKVIIITKDDKFYELDHNKSAELSLNQNSTDSAINETIVENLCDKKIVDFAFGYYYVIALTIDGKIYSWNNSYANQVLDHNSDNYVINHFFVENNLKITQIKSAEEYSLALTETGEVYVWGWDSNDPIGGQTEPFLANGLNGKKIVSISCGARYSLALDENGFVYYLRGHEFEEKWIEFKEKQTFRKIFSKKRFKKISCGKNHSLLLTIEGHIMAYGSNFWAQIGNGRKGGFVKTPIELNIKQTFKEIATHSKRNISAALSMDNKFYVWGKCGDNCYLTPSEVEFTSFDDIFAEFCRICHKTIDGIFHFDDTFIFNGRYTKSFKDENPIGSGSYGTVFEVTNNWKSKKYAVKKIKCKINEENELLNEFKSSVILRKFNDKRVVRYFDFWFENNSNVNSNESKLMFYILMEICDQSLHHFIHKEMSCDPVLKVGESLTSIGYLIASQLLIEILESVDFLHKQNKPIIHRDLKPDNILIKKDYSSDRRFIRIADFGLITLHKYAQQTHTPDLGHITYAAPEVLNGGDYDTKSDIYGLGKVMQKLLCIEENTYQLTETQY